MLVGPPKANVMEDLIRYDLDEPNTVCFFLTGSNLREWERTEFIEFLTTNIEVFAWTPYEMSGIDQDFIKDELNVIPEAHPVKQQGRRSATEHVDAVMEEVEKLKEASAITKVIHLSWLSNTVVVKKKIGK